MKKTALVLLLYFCFFNVNAQTLEQLDSLYIVNLKNGNYTAAVKFSQKMGQMTLKKYGKESKQYAANLYQLGIAFQYSGQLSEAKITFEEALDIRRKIFGLNHPNYANILNSLARIYVESGDYEVADSLYRTAMKIYEESLGLDHISYVNTRFNYATLLFQKGNFAAAEPIMLKMLEKKKSLISAKHPDYANSMNNLASLYRLTGNVGKAKRLYLEIIQLRKETLGKKHPYYIASIGNLATLFNDLKEYEKAKPYYEEALALQEQVLGKGHPDYSLTLNNLGILYNNLEEYDKAAQLLKEALLIREQVFGQENPQFAKSLESIANLEISRSNYQEAERLLLQAESIKKVIYGEDHPEYTTTTKNLALLYYLKGDLEKAKPFFIHFQQKRIDEIQNNFAYMSENEKETYYTLFSEEFDIFKSFAMDYYQKNGTMAEDLWMHIIKTKGILLNNSMQIRNKILNSGQAEVLNLFNQYLMLKEQYVKYMHFSKDELAKMQVDLTQIESQIRNFEKELAFKSQVFADEMNKKDLRFEDFSGFLDGDMAMIEYFDYKKYRKKHFWDTTFYGALVFHDEMKQPEVLTLSNSKVLEPFFQNSLSIYQVSDYIMDENMRKELSALIWFPVEEIVSNKNRLYISTSDVINKVSFYALLDMKGKFLIDQYNVTYLSNIKNIRKEVAYDVKGKMKIDIYGGLRYDNETSKSEGTDVQKEDALTERWIYLPGTEKEAVKIADLLSQKSWQVDKYEGREGREEIFKKNQGNMSPNVIHLSTHGFFMDRNVESPRNAFQSSGNPLYRSGLILSGANDAWQGLPVTPDAEDGILTAYEVANTYLKNTKLAILAACETGLGVSSGSEVYGLQRSFLIAGVDQLMMSLWSVPDQETIILMEYFYQFFLESGNAAEALRKAQVEMSRKFGPFFWAAFIIVS